MGLFKGWFKRKNAQAVEDKDKGEHKLNALDVFVDVDGKKVSASKLEKYMAAEEAEQAALNAQDEPVADDQAEAISMDEEFVASNGKKYNVGQMVAVYKKRNAEAAEKEEAEFEKADAKAKAEVKEADLSKSNEKEERLTDKERAAEAKADNKENAEEPKDEKKEAEEPKAKEEEELKIKKENAKKNDEYFVRLNSLRDSAEGAQDHGVETMSTKLNRGKERYGSKV